jgi:hypothetical protein
MALVAGFLLGFGAAWWVQKEMVIDACLDAGGRWQSAGRYCEGVIP